MYERAQAEQQASAQPGDGTSENGGGGASASSSDEEVVDAEVVDEQK